MSCLQYTNLETVPETTDEREEVAASRPQLVPANRQAPKKPAMPTVKESIDAALSDGSRSIPA
jgi:hypothetical protein